MDIKTLEVAGLMSALKGMRNPINSWHLSDTVNEGNNIVIGEKDLKLAQNLIKSGTEHCKFMRQIHVWCDIDMPRYIWSEFDTYHFNTKNSCSTMHRLLHKTTSITRDLFVYNEEVEIAKYDKEIKVINNKTNIDFLKNILNISESVEI